MPDLPTEGEVVSDENPYAIGPPPGYVPPDPDEFRDPEHKRRTHQQIRDDGAALVREALAANGIRKVDGEWKTDDPTSCAPHPRGVTSESQQDPTTQ